ncbi:hypothetical protein FNV43_RR10504 [Rhamnella rubrinervis]|uniref:Uncharacterized protein n=1 Tax=Rhamnella rubrinervis TaxID=2594499 RepID=A0A8K0MGZ8_9ROSA|nr:hypothetical protein FNV43_RR10504 [Rhamnella rubrinervis]
MADIQPDISDQSESTCDQEDNCDQLESTCDQADVIQPSRRWMLLVLRPYEGRDTRSIHRLYDNCLPDHGYSPTGHGYAPIDHNCLAEYPSLFKTRRRAGRSEEDDLSVPENPTEVCNYGLLRLGMKEDKEVSHVPSLSLMPPVSELGGSLNLNSKSNHSCRAGPGSSFLTDQVKSRRPATSASAAIEESYRHPDSWFVLWLIFVVLVSVISTVTIVSNVPEFPSISIKSMSMTAITNVSDTHIKASLEMVFDPVENINKHNSIIYDRVNVTAFDVKEGLFSDATFEQRGSDKRAVVDRMKNVTVDVSEYEQHIYGRYGVSYLNFEIAGFIRIEGGKWSVKLTTSIRAVSDQVSKKGVIQ